MPNVNSTLQRSAIFTVFSNASSGLWEALAQLLLGFEIEFFRLKFQAVRIVDGLAHLDAHQDILRPRILAPEVVRSFVTTSGNPVSCERRRNALIDARLLLEAVILQFEIKVLRPEDLRVFQRGLLGLLILVVQQCLAARARPDTPRAR